MKEGGFHLTKFTSNSRKLLATLPEKERANPALNLDLDQLPIGRALGLHWDADSDTFLFKVVPTNKPPTKRGILSTVSSLFDPLGFMGPFILPVKVLLQELWRMGIQWDERVPEPLLTQWHRWSLFPSSQNSRSRDVLEILLMPQSPTSSCTIFLMHLTMAMLLLAT